MIDQNLIMYFPMDDPEGGSVAFDYSKSRKDATLSNGAYFSRDAVKGKSLALNGGSAVTDTVVPFSSDFTICMYIKPTSGKIGWLLNFSGIDNYKEHWLDVVPGKWIFLVIVKQSAAITTYVDYQKESTVQLTPGTNPVGLSLNDTSLYGTSCLIDDVKMYNNAMEIAELMAETKSSSDVEYFVNGTNFKEFGVYVSASNGLVSQLERKEGLTEDWGMRHGIQRNQNYVRFKERTITLECFIEASSRSAFVEWLNHFYDQFRSRGTKRLRVEYSGSTKPLLYEVTMQAPSDPDKQFGRYNEDLMVGTFTITLVEDDPVKMVLRHIFSSSSQNTASFTLTSVYPVIVFWGDGTSEVVKAKSSTTVSHTYSNAGEYDIIIAGVIEEITNFSTSDIVVWQRLM